MNKKTFKSLLTLEIQTVDKKFPTFDVSHNNKKLTALSSDNKVINFEFESLFGNNTLEICFYNKTDQDTIINSNGDIVEDLAIKIKNFDISNFDLTDNVKLNSLYFDEHRNILTTYGYIGKNGKLTFDYVCPPFYYMRQMN